MGVRVWWVQPVEGTLRASGREAERRARQVCCSRHVFVFNRGHLQRTVFLKRTH